MNELIARFFKKLLRANERLAQKNEQFAHLLFYHEQPVWIDHGCSFVMSDLSDSLTGAHFWWATWVIFSQSLICPERSELIAHSCSFKWAILSKWAMSQWVKSQPCKLMTFYRANCLSYCQVSPPMEHIQGGQWWTR